MLKKLMCAAVLALSVQAASAQGFSDNSLGYRYGNLFAYPGVADGKHPRGENVDVNTLNFSHVDGYKYGANFLSMDILKSNHRDPANNSADGAVEFYFLYRGDLSPNAIFDTTAFTFGPLRDITLQAGFDVEAKNTFFAPQKDLIVIGPNFHFNTPGFLNVAVQFAKEWNHNGVTGVGVSFDPQVIFAFVYSYPLDFQKLVPLRFEGFTNFQSPKGRDGFGLKTAWEILSQDRLVLDLGQVALGRPRFIDAFIGFEYWLNKYGNDHTKNVGALQLTPLFGTAIHF